ncbi:hypothetical protein BUZ15_14835, partial [Staphylococcus gallinarum]
IAATMVKYGFKVLKLNRIWGSLDARNVAARIVLQNANMKHEAVLIPKSIEAFGYNIEYNQYHPDSIFVQRLLITQPQSFGRA